MVGAEPCYARSAATNECADFALAGHPVPAEPIPTPGGPGRIILLNGASSSGKSTLAKSLQATLGEPFLHVSSDQFVAAGMLPPRHDDGGPFDWWHQVRPRFFAGFHQCLPALAAAGNDLIVEHIIEFSSWRADLAALLSNLDVFLVGVHCALDELDRRERGGAAHRLPAHSRSPHRTGSGRGTGSRQICALDRQQPQSSNAFSDRSNFGEPLDCVLVVPADGGFPRGRRLRGDVVRAVVEAGGVVGQHEIEVGDVDVRLVQSISAT